MSQFYQLIICWCFLFGNCTAVDFIVKIPHGKASWKMSFASCHDFPGKYSEPSNDASAVGKPFNWNLISDRNPDAFIWGGDIIYGDFPKEMMFLPFPITLFLPDMPIMIKPFAPSTPEKLSHMYESLKQDSGYAELVRELGGHGSHRILGTWDDHDYGLNDGDKTLSIREGSKESFLKFFEANENDPRGTRSGVYSSTLFIEGKPLEHDIGQKGGEDNEAHNDDQSPHINWNKSVLVIALDMRYNKDPYSVSNGDFLGEEQWIWLEETLLKSKARAHVIISSLQLLPEGREIVTECWNDFPKNREKILNLMYKMKVKSPIIVSGDVHYAEIMAAHCGNENEQGDISTLVELTTSGLTHSWAHGMGLFSKEMKQVSALAMKFFQHFIDWPYQTQTQNKFKDFYLDLNFGEIDFVWSSSDNDDLSKVHVRVLDGISGEDVISKEFYLKHLDMKGASSSPSPVCKPHRPRRNYLIFLLGWLWVGGLIALVLVAKPLCWVLVIYVIWAVAANYVRSDDREKKKKLK